MAEKVRCEKCNRNFKNEEGLAMHNHAKHFDEEEVEKKPLITKKIRNWGIFIVIFGVFLFGIVWSFTSISSAQELPPTTMAGHVEASPPAHVIKKPMGVAVQKHMLEHVDGNDGGKGGVIINYNCKDFECEDDLISNLESFAGKFNYVYVAPFKNMPVKIALTKLGFIETYDEYDSIKIETFITGIIPESG
ncbi:MAG: hypothetical protein IH845_01115 [Nanoarchaeota archaeon]|nr:hypothetical protein [Nanoarchaeota archaeon]